MIAVRRLWRFLMGRHVATSPVPEPEVQFVPHREEDWAEDAAMLMTDEHWYIVHTVLADRERKRAQWHTTRASLQVWEAEQHMFHFRPSPNMCQDCNDAVETGFAPNPACNQCPTLRKELQ